MTPHLKCVDGADAAIRFYGTCSAPSSACAWAAAPGDADDKVGHAELQIGDGLIMLSDEYPEMGSRSPKSVGGTPVTLSVYVEDVDAVFERARRWRHRAAARRAAVLRRPLRPVRGPVRPPPSVATHVEDVSPEEMARRAAEMGEG